MTAEVHVLRPLHLLDCQYRTTNLYSLAGVSWVLALECIENGRSEMSWSDASVDCLLSDIEPVLVARLTWKLPAGDEGSQFLSLSSKGLHCTITTPSGNVVWRGITVRHAIWDLYLESQAMTLACDDEASRTTIGRVFNDQVEFYRYALTDSEIHFFKGTAFEGPNLADLFRSAYPPDPPRLMVSDGRYSHPVF